VSEGSIAREKGRRRRRRRVGQGGPLLSDWWVRVVLLVNPGEPDLDEFTVFNEEKR